MGTNPDQADAFPDAHDAGAAADALLQVEALADTLRTAAALVSSNRRIDLGGIDHQMQALCGRVLDLPPHRAAMLRPRLSLLMGRIDALLLALATAAQKAVAP